MITIDYAKYDNATPRQLTRYYDSAIFQMKKREQEAKVYAELAKFLSNQIAKAYSAPILEQEKYLRPHELSINAEIEKMDAENPQEAQRIRNEVLKEMYGDSNAGSN